MHKGQKTKRVLGCATALAGLAPLMALAAVPQIPVAPPPMGWSSWNSFGDNISEAIIDQQADALAKFDATLPPGTAAYDRVNIDDGFWPVGNGRNADGVPILDPTLWPGGTLAGAVTHIHGDGLLAGAYTDVGKTGCAGDGGSEGYYIPDMLRFAQEGFDYVKVDFCGGQTENLDPEETYANIAQAVQYAEYETGRSIYLSLCDWGYYGPAGFPDSAQGPWTWAPGVNLVPADIWRTSEDITFDVGPSGSASFEDVLLNFHSSIHPESQHTGYHNDPDMMVIGINGVDNDPSDPVQSEAHMSLWAVDGAPLLIGANMQNVLQEPAIEAVLGNPLAIAIDQDGRGLQAVETAASRPGLEVWSRLLSGSGRRAVVLLNTTTAPVEMKLTASELGLAGTSFATENVWTGQSAVASGGSILDAVAAQGATMLLVTGTDLPSTDVAATSVEGSEPAQTAILPASIQAGAAPVNQGPTPLDITYENATANAIDNVMTTNGGSGTVVAFPPTGKSKGTVSVITDLNKGVANTLSFASVDGSTGPRISKVAVVAGPVPAFQPVYQADARTSTLSGAAVVQPCSSCSDGSNVGYVGTGGSSSGALTISGVMAAKAGLYTILVAYLNGDSNDRQATVTVNGGPDGTFNFPRGKDWNTVLVAPITVQLRQGANAITFSNASAYAPNFSALGAPR